MTFNRNQLKLAGYTLVEILVAAALLLLLLTLLYSFLVPALRASSRGTIRAEMESQALFTLSRMTEDLQLSSPTGTSFNTYAYNSLTGSPLYPTDPPTAPMGVAIQRIQLVGAVGCAAVQQWETGVDAYAYIPVSPTEGNVVVFDGRSEDMFVPSVQPSKLKPGSVDDLINDLGWPVPPVEQTLATGVNVFQLSYSLTPTPAVSPTCAVWNPNAALLYMGSPLIITLGLQRSGATGQISPETFSLTRYVYMRN